MHIHSGASGPPVTPSPLNENPGLGEPRVPEYLPPVPGISLPLTFLTGEQLFKRKVPFVSTQVSDSTLSELCHRAHFAAALLICGGGRHFVSALWMAGRPVSLL